MVLKVGLKLSISYSTTSNMVHKKLRLRLTPKRRPHGNMDAYMCVELCVENWEEIQAAFKIVSKEVQEDLRDYFNSAVD